MLKLFYALLFSLFFLFIFGGNGESNSNDTASKSASLSSGEESTSEMTEDFYNEVIVESSIEYVEYKDVLDTSDSDVVSDRILNINIEKEIEYVSFNIFHHNACMGVANFDSLDYYIASIDYSSLDVDYDFYNDLFLTCKNQVFHNQAWWLDKYEELYFAHGAGYDYILSRIFPAGHPKATRWIILSSVWNEENETKLLSLDENIYFTDNQRLFFKLLNGLNGDIVSYEVFNSSNYDYFLDIAKAYKTASAEEKEKIASFIANDFVDDILINTR